VAPVERIKRWTEQYRIMKERGLNIPVPFGHQKDATPAHWDDAERAAYLASRYNAGYVRDLRQEPDGSLSAEIECPNLSLDAKSGCLIDPKTGTAIKEVSIGIMPTFRDGKGNSYTDVIGHVALVPHPAWANQDGFKNLSVQTDQFVCLSLGAGTSWQQVNLSHEKGSQMAEKMPDDLLADDKPPKEEKEEKEEPKVEKAEHEEGHSNSDGEFSRMLGLLAKKGIKLPDNTTQKNLAKWLLIVLEALMANSPAPADVGAPPPDLGTALPETPPMVGMSLNGQPIGPVAEKLLMA
jgi:hypothetical protein